MTRDDALLADIDQDLQRSGRSGRVLYLEGDGDPDVLFGLLGVSRPIDIRGGRFEHEGVLVRGLSGGGGTLGSGASAVRRRVDLARERGRRGVFGLVDGDGDAHRLLAQEFDPPFAGPLFRWKAYAIENLLVQTGWPAHWGREPQWAKVFRDVAPYVALNRLGLQIRRALADVGLEAYQEPSRGQPLLRSREVIRKLVAQPHLLPKRGVVEAYRRELAQFSGATLDEKHARLNGKWLVEWLPPSKGRRSKELCRAEWIQEAVRRGGHEDVRSLWARALRPPAALVQ